MGSDAGETYALPADPVLAEVSAALQQTGHWAWVVDDRWQLVYVTAELRRTFGGGDLAPFAIGAHMFGPEAIEASRRWRFGPNTPVLNRVFFESIGGWVLANTPGGEDELRKLVDPSLQDVVGWLAASEAASVSALAQGTGLWTVEDVLVLGMRVHATDGRHAGTVLISKPAAGMSVLGAMTVGADQRHVERVQRVAVAGRRPSAILFADLEGSSPLARHMSTANYFAFTRRLVRTADQVIIDAGGIVGRHAGDGVVAFFLAENAGSESAAARGCISAARSLRSALAEVATRSGLEAGDVRLRFGLHWGSMLYVGNISTGGRSEVTALGDEVNEAARIEACASGGRALASKPLVERLERDDADALGLDPERIVYEPLAELAGAPEKARRDAPALAVCDVTRTDGRQRTETNSTSHVRPTS